jgi:hypothetical protein
MSLQSCYECGKEISSKAIMCPQCGAPQNPVSGLIDKTKRFFAKREKGFLFSLMNSLSYFFGSFLIVCLCIVFVVFVMMVLVEVLDILNNYI